MKIAYLVLVLHCSVFIVSAEQAETRDLDDNEDLERKHRKRKKHQNNNNGGCGSGGLGKTFGEKFFGLHDYTYVSAPVMNYFFGCGIAAVPVAQPVAPVVPIAPVHPAPAYPIQIGVSQSQNQQGHGGGGHGGLGSHGSGLGNHGGFDQGGFQGYNPGYNQPIYQPGYNQVPMRPFNNRPFQNIVSAAASGFGTALADYIGSRPRRTYKQINKQVNQLLRPLYKLF